MNTIKMSPEFSLSLSEHKILFAIGFLLCSFYFLNISDKAITAYNVDVKSEQLENQRIADNESGFSFDICSFRRTPIYEVILGLQFLLLPLLLLTLKRLDLRRFITSQLLSFVILLGYIGWMFETYDLVKSGIFLENENLQLFNNYILLQSTVLEVVIFLLLTVLFVIQLAFLMRFIIEKFQSKLS